MTSDLEDSDAQTLNTHAARLAQSCPNMARALAICGQLPSRKRPQGFETLWHTVVGQVISIQAAQTIWQRLIDRGLTSAQGVHSASDETLRACGLSRPKIKTVRAILDAQIDFDVLSQESDAEVENQLIKIWGVGQWTARIYLVFALDRPDILAANDLALQAAAQMLLNMPTRPSPKELEAICEKWRPYRSVAAQILWAYYAVTLQEGT